MKTEVTALLSSSSMVKRVRFQSQLAPSFFNCSSIIPPYLLVQSQAWPKNSSRLISFFLMPFSANILTTLASVAILAWSVPGTQQAFLPSIRALRINTSWMVLFNIWPMCKTPVTFGGGMTMVNGSRSSGTESKNPLSIQY